jgi:hypothetical protein
VTLVALSDAQKEFMSKRIFPLAVAFAFQSLGLLACSRSPVQADLPANLPASLPTNFPDGAPQSARAQAEPLGAAVDAATGKPFGALCTKDEECAQSVCFHKRIKGADSGPERRDVRPEAEEREGYCSMRCTTDADCPTPLTRGKCGARGMCKRTD